MKTYRLTKSDDKYSKLLYPTYDARLTDLKIAPKCYNTKVSYKLTMYDSELEEKVKRKMLFEDVVAIDFFNSKRQVECIVSLRSHGR